MEEKKEASFESKEMSVTKIEHCVLKASSFKPHKARMLWIRCSTMQIPIL